MNLSLTKDRTPAQRWHDIAYWGLWLVACAVFYQIFYDVFISNY